MTKVNVNIPPHKTYNHKRGNIYLKYNRLFILLQFDLVGSDAAMGLIALDSGNRERNSMTVRDVLNVTQEEFESMGGDDGFHLIKTVNIDIEFA